MAGTDLGNASFNLRGQELSSNVVLYQRLPRAGAPPLLRGELGRLGPLTEALLRPEERELIPLDRLEPLDEEPMLGRLPPTLLDVMLLLSREGALRVAAGCRDGALGA